MFKKTAAAAFAVCVISMCLCGCKPPVKAETESEMKTVSEAEVEEAAWDMSTAEVVRDMGVGINLGNTFESCGSWISSSSVSNYETAWGSSVITKETIQGYKDCGFGVLRIPVAWSNMMMENYTIHPDYTARVKEVIDWALESDLYVIMNIHWDGGWFKGFADDEKREECFYKYERVWEQLAEEFRNHGEKLMFESLNEKGGWDTIWNPYSNDGDKEKSFGILNNINQRFVDIVRGSGGNNTKRHLLIAGYNTDIERTCDAEYKMPDDPSGRCAVSVHYYTPSTFAILEQDADWGRARRSWGTEKDYEQLYGFMDMMKTNFVDKGIPVIIGEYGATAKNKEPNAVRKYISSVCEAAYVRGMCPLLWDASAYYDRTNAVFYDKELLKQIMDVKELERTNSAAANL